VTLASRLDPAGNIDVTKVGDARVGSGPFYPGGYRNHSVSGHLYAFALSEVASLNHPPHPKPWHTFKSHARPIARRTLKSTEPLPRPLTRRLPLIKGADKKGGVALLVQVRNFGGRQFDGPACYAQASVARAGSSLAALADRLASRALTPVSLNRCTICVSTSRTGQPCSDNIRRCSWVASATY
jgi:hypothetical protein